MPDIRVQPDPFDYGQVCAAFAQAHCDNGAIVSFCGIVRGENGLQAMEIEHYPGMTERALHRIAEQAMTRWTLGGALILHRHGPLTPGEPIMMVATAARHRADAFAAADFMMDYLKSRAPFWKKERRASGESWVAARDLDEQALSRW
ncbi:MAG: molybdenum cofactor biosynthesis protein MoaE [Rhodobacteraceae bacterium]|nr:molybdenum cofactor biosynthesis protein MoaE [Paracoccaceae bacterium]